MLFPSPINFASFVHVCHESSASDWFQRLFFLEWIIATSFSPDKPASSLAPLQRVLNAAARFVADLHPRDHVTATLRDLHWLPIKTRITYKLCTLMHVSVDGAAPVYIRNMLTSVTELSGRSHLRSAASGLYDVPHTRTKFGTRSFSSAGPTAWNALPLELRATVDSACFRKKLKTFLFIQVYWSWPWFTLIKIKVDWPYCKFDIDLMCKVPLAMHVSGVDKCLNWIEFGVQAWRPHYKTKINKLDFFLGSVREFSRNISVDIIKLSKDSSGFSLRNLLRKLASLPAYFSASFPATFPVGFMECFSGFFWDFK